MESGPSVGVGGKFGKSCCLKIHTSTGKETLYELDQRRYISSTEKQLMLDENLLKESKVNRPNRKLCVCDECLQLVRNMMSNPAKKLKADKVPEDTVSTAETCSESDRKTGEAVQIVVDAIQNGSIEEQQS
ncbi:unnamed protein product [Orchesella dallaii]|uniref:ZAD domain-containing protein n=1 Tax=Orchesella dallaii TaxID=48710 RepID=A0ABP1RJT6_9HEXA